MSKRNYRFIANAIISGVDSVAFVALQSDEKRTIKIFTKVVGHPWGLFKRAGFRVGKVEIRHVSKRRKLGRVKP